VANLFVDDDRVLVIEREGRGDAVEENGKADER
jgi:hypothetical protein